MTSIPELSQLLDRPLNSDELALLQHWSEYDPDGHAAFIRRSSGLSPRQVKAELLLSLIEATYNRALLSTVAASTDGNFYGTVDGGGWGEETRANLDPSIALLAANVAHLQLQFEPEKAAPPADYSDIPF
jgi:hypothetical protein